MSAISFSLSLSSLSRSVSSRSVFSRSVFSRSVSRRSSITASFGSSLSARKAITDSPTPCSLALCLSVFSRIDCSSKRSAPLLSAAPYCSLSLHLSATSSSGPLSRGEIGWRGLLGRPRPVALYCPVLLCTAAASAATIAAGPGEAAMWKRTAAPPEHCCIAVKPFEERMLGSIPASSSASATASFAARCSAVKPPLLVALTSQPLSISALTALKWPLSAALWRGVSW